MLQILDAEKNNPSITLRELQKKFAAQFGISPTADGFYFYNQHQFLTSLLAYICMPSEKFFTDIPDIEINALGPVDIHFNSMTVTARLIMALKL